LKKTEVGIAMETIYLIGFMGAGKTTIGKELGKHLGIPVLDLDEEIEKQEKKSINQIFEQHGEAYFRDCETKLLQKLKDENAVITTGGGIITREENRLLLEKEGTVFFLFATMEEIMKRLEHDDSRPLLKGNKKQQVINLYKERMTFYQETADYMIDTTGKEIKELIIEIIHCLKQS